MSLTIGTILLSLLSALLSGLVVAAVTNWMTRKREQAAKNREIVLTKIVSVWELLNDLPNKKSHIEVIDTINGVMDLVLLYGTTNEIEKTKRIAVHYVERSRSESALEYGDLQKEIRNRIRIELGLSEIEEGNWRLEYPKMPNLNVEKKL